MSEIVGVSSCQEMSALSSASSAEERQCWVCFITDKEVPDAAWVQPCLCRGTSRWVHASCLLRWIDERQKGQLDSVVQCSQCQVPYKVTLPAANAIEVALERTTAVFTDVSPLVTISSLAGAFTFCMFKYGETAVYVVLGHAEAQRVVDETDPLYTIFGCTMLPVVCLGIAAINWEEKLLSGIRRLYPHAQAAFHSVLASFARAAPSKETELMSEASSTISSQPHSPRAATPPPENNENLNVHVHFDADGISLSRTLVSAFTLPFIATAVGRLCFSRAIKGNAKRAVCGGLVYMALKGVAKMYLIHRHGERIKHRRILDHLP